MNNKMKKVIMVAGIVSIFLQGHAATYVLENSTGTFWSVSHSWHEAVVWKEGSVVPSPSSHTVAISSKPVDHTVNLFEESVSISTLNVGQYANDTDVVTLNVTTNLDLSYRLQVGYAGGNGTMIVSNATVSVANKIYLGSTDSDIYSGNLIVDESGLVETADMLYMYTNGTLTVNGSGVMKIMASAGERVSMVESSRIYLNDNAQLILNGDQTWSGSPLNSFINSGWIFGDGISGNVAQAYDGTNTVVTVKPFATGTVVLQNTSAAFWGIPQSWHEHDIWKDGLLPADTADIIMVAKPTDYRVNIVSQPVTINSLKSKFGVSGTYTPILNVQTNLTINNFLQLGVEENGAMVVDAVNFVLVKGTVTLGSASFAGSLTVTNGGIIRCNNPLVMNANSSVNIQGGLFKLLETSSAPLSMSEGSVINIEGTNSVLLVYGDQTGAESSLSTYIDNGWILGNGNVGELELLYDSTNNLTRAFALTTTTYESFVDEYGMTGEPGSGINEDYDGDGQLNIYEWGLGGNPTNPSDIGVAPVWQILEQGDTNVIEYIHLRLVDADISYHLETDTDLATLPGWTNAHFSVVGVGPEINGFETVTNEVTLSGNTGFVKLVIEQP